MQAIESARQFGKFLADCFGFLVDRRRLEVMGKQAFPVGFHRVMDGMPVPVFDHLGTGCQMADCLQPQLTRERRPGWESLCFGFQNQIGRIFQTACLVTRLCNLNTSQTRLCWMIDITSSNIQTLSDPIVVNIRLDTVRVSGPVEVKVMGDKLVGTGVFPDDGSLPGQIIGNQTALEFLKFRRETAVDGSSHIRDIFPCVHPVAPVVKTKSCVQSVGRTEFIPQIPDKHPLDIIACGTVIFGFVIDLVADDCRMIADMLHQFADHPFTIKQVGR